MKTVEEYNQEIEALMKKYKLSMFAIIACIAVYVVCLFWVKNTYITLAVCVPMVLLAFWNNKVAKQLKELVNQRNKQAALDKGEDPEAAVSAAAGEPGAIVANAKSLNDLPKEYTVLDQVSMDGKTIEHVILSPYGIAVVDTEDWTQPMEAMLQDLELTAPIYSYQPEEDVALLAEKIQLPKDVVLNETNIYKILYRLTGLD